MRVFKFFLDLLAPKKCYSCLKEGTFLCQNCHNKIPKHLEVCFVCKRRSKSFDLCEDCKKEVYYDKIIILNYYNDTLISKLIKQAKFYWKNSILEDLVPYLYDIFILNHKIINKEDYLITSIPLHFLKKIKRGFNQSEILCEEFSKISNIKYKKNILKKIRKTKQQSLLSRNERLKNLKDSFIMNKKFILSIKDKRIILLDDVVTTWSTINEISKILKQFWAKEVIWLTLASG